MTEFDDLYRKHAPEVFRFALYLCGDHAEAEDLTSETFVRVWTAPEPVRLATARGYLFTIVRNLFLQGLRRKKRQTALDDDFPDKSPRPGARAEQEAELDAVLAALQKIPESDRVALLMRAQQDMSYEEIARALGITLAAVKARIHRARLALLGIRQA
jgi:RNA polymerase sigma-70 factor, ECF subfamily